MLRTNLARFRGETVPKTAPEEAKTAMIASLVSAGKFFKNLRRKWS